MEEKLTNKGFTLIETVLIIVLLAIAIPTLVLLLGQSAGQGVNAELDITSTNRGKALMEEIKSKRWDENSPIPPGAYTNPPAPEGGEARTLCTGTPSSFDDIDDYNGYSESCPLGGSNYTSSIQICYVNAADLESCVAGTSDYKRIQITVTNIRSGSVELVTVMTNY